MLNRANARMTIFDDDGDYEAFEAILEQAVARFETRLLAYCSMPNHWHLVVWPRNDGELSSLVGWLTVLTPYPFSDTANHRSVRCYLSTTCSPLLPRTKIDEAVITEVNITVATSPSVSEFNRELARAINQEARDNPRSPLAGKFVAILSGQIVAVADDLDELVQRLHEVDADPGESLCLEVGLDYGQVQEIWGLG